MISKLLPALLLTAGAALSMTGCATTQATSNGQCYENWQKVGPSNWTAGLDPATNMAGLYASTGSLFVDFKNRQASGSGVQQTANGRGLRWVWRITGMHLISARWDVGPNSAAPLRPVVVFDGDFAVYRIQNNQVAGEMSHGHAAFDLTGPMIMTEPGYRQLTLQVAPAGISFRDGIDLQGMANVTALSFH